MPESKNKLGSSMNIPIVILIGGALIIGYLVARVQSLQQGTGGRGTTTQTNDQTQPDQQAPQRPTSLDIEKPDPKSDHWRGSTDAQFVMVEYSDLECPFCQRYHATPPKMLEEFKDVAWVYRHFPLSFHANAQKEAEASECAAELGGTDAFWDYIDKIFERTTANGTGFPLDGLVPLAKELGLNESKFKSCLDGGKYEKKVKDQLDEGSKAGVAATPTTVLYNMKTGATEVIEGALPEDQVRTTLENFVKG